MRSALLFVFAAVRPSASGVQILHGGGLELVVDLTGWIPEQGKAILHDDYVRPGLFSAANGQDISILVDDIPKGVVDLNALCVGSEQSYGGNKVGLKVLESDTVAGKPACLFTFPTEMSRRNFYVEMMVEGHWLEIHYSAPDGRNAIPLARQSLETIVSSMVAKRVESPRAELPVADITDAEVALAQNRQHCGSKSKDFVCRALAAFKEGRRPSRHPKPVGVAGITMPIVFGLALDVVETRPTYVVVSDTGAAMGSFGGPGSKDDAKASSQLIRSVKAGQLPDENNPLVIAARARTEVKPGGLAERSFVISRGFLRETSMGFIYVAFVPNGVEILLSVYPTP